MKLGVPGKIKKIEVDTAHFKGSSKKVTKESFFFLFFLVKRLCYLEQLDYSVMNRFIF